MHPEQIGLKAEREFDLRPVMPKLAAGDVTELVQYLPLTTPPRLRQSTARCFLGAEVAV